jgi:hypothetical protein
MHASLDGRGCLLDRWVEAACHVGAGLPAGYIPVERIAVIKQVDEFF